MDLVKEILLKSKTRKSKTIEFRTFDEGLCDANYFVVSKEEINNRFEAFVSLLNYEIHFYEEWKLSETTQENIEGVIENFITPNIQRYEFKSLSADEVVKNTEYLVESIRELIAKSYVHSDPLRWGIYIDNDRVSDEQEFIPISESIHWAIGLELEWNAIEIFFETNTEFVLFSWGTGA